VTDIRSIVKTYMYALLHMAH